MSDRNRASGITLAEALRALPPTAPERSVWPQLAAQLAAQNGTARPQRMRRHALPLALAAGLALAFVATQIDRRNVAPSNPAGTATTASTATVSPLATSSVANATNEANATNANNSGNAAQLVALQTHSQALEHWLRETRAAAGPLPGQDLAAVAEIEDMIGLVDVELAAPTRAAALPLWQRRVALLEDLTALRYSNYSVAKADASNRATWIN